MIFRCLLALFLSSLTLSANECMNFKAAVEFLYLKPCIEQDECALRLKTMTDPLFTQTIGHYETWHYSWRPSFRLFLGADSNIGTFAFSYLYLNNKSCNEFFARDDVVLNTPINLNPSFSNFSRLFAQHQFDYHHFDLFYEQPIFLFCCDLLIPFIGIEALVLNQTVKLQGESADFLQSLEEHQRANFWGIGLTAGSSLLYAITACFDLFAEMGGSLIYGPLDEKINVTTINTPFTTQDTFFTKSNPNLLVPSFKLGVGFDFHVKECLCPFTMRIGYEFIEWFYLWAYRTPSNSSNFTQPNRSNLQLNGLTLGILIAF